jgi:hypothetical protein
MEPAMLDHPSDTPSARPPLSLIEALRTDERVRISGVPPRGAGIPAEPNGLGGFHVGRGTLVRVNNNPPIPWAEFVGSHDQLSKLQLRAIFADLSVAGAHAGVGGALEIAVVTEVSGPSLTLERLQAEARLARLDAAYAQLSEVRRRYAADTACNAWTIEQALLDVANAALKATEAMAVRAEAA